MSRNAASSQNRSKRVPILPAVALCLIALGPACAEPASSEPPLACTAQGSAILVPAMRSAAVCERFSAALDAALTHQQAALALRDGIVVQLQFARSGEIIAQVTLPGTSSPDRRIDAGLAVSDRPLTAGDIDQLASEVARQLIGRRSAD